MAHELQELMYLIETGRDRGAQATEVFLEEAEGLTVDIVRGRPQKRAFTERGLRVRCWVAEGRFGDAEGTPDDGQGLVEKALAAAHKAPADPVQSPVGRLPVVTRGLGIDDRRFPNLSESDRIDVVVAAERGAKGVDPRIKARDFRYADQRVRRAYISNNETLVEERSTTYEAGGRVEVEVPRGPLVLEDFVAGRSFASVSSFPFGTVLARRAIALLGDAIGHEGPVRVMMPPRVTGHLFARLAEGFRHDLLDTGGSLFAAGFGTGQTVVDGRIHLIDDPQLPGGLRTQAFDEEGVPPVPLALLREGVVEGRYRDLATARRQEIRPTGHRWKGTLRPANLQLRSGTRSMSALLSEHSDVLTLVLDHVEGMWEGLDLATGDFRVRGSGFLQRGNDQVDGVLRRAWLEGNVLDVLSQLVDIASDTDRVAHVDAPGMLVEGIRVAATPR